LLFIIPEKRGYCHLSFRAIYTKDEKRLKQKTLSFIFLAGFSKGGAWQLLILVQVA
jgi:hypothetical protein